VRSAGITLLVQIPCLNEEENLASVINSVNRKIQGVSEVKILVIDDGSTDETRSIAIQNGVDFVLTKPSTRGLADSFKLGQEFFLHHDFDILVNTDGDNQYFQESIQDLISPIIMNDADVVVGDRSTWGLAHFSLWKRTAQKLGSKVVSHVARAKVPDAASGFRAYSKMAVASIFITTRFSYAMESIIQAGNKGLRISSVVTGAKQVSRGSRLFTSPSQHMRKSAAAILKGFLMYQPLRIFSSLALFLFIVGAIPMARYLLLMIGGSAGDHLQSLLLGSLLMSTSVTFLVLGLVAELSRVHRQLTEDRLTIDRLQMKAGGLEFLAVFGASLWKKTDHKSK
jgi:glycosyltransferase involved in cell wall biosynthesis